MASAEKVVLTITFVNGTVQNLEVMGGEGRVREEALALRTAVLSKPEAANGPVLRRRSASPAAAAGSRGEPGGR